MMRRAKFTTCIIGVDGYLDENKSVRPGTLQINTSQKNYPRAVTTRSRPIINQAALFGVLNAPDDVRLPLHRSSDRK